jgi:predicted  nucleic acid-binding Zn-ribbon protein
VSEAITAGSKAAINGAKPSNTEGKSRELGTIGNFIVHIQTYRSGGETAVFGSPKLGKRSFPGSIRWENAAKVDAEGTSKCASSTISIASSGTVAEVVAGVEVDAEVEVEAEVEAEAEAEA